MLLMPVGSPGQVCGKFNTQVGMVIDFLKQDSANIVFCRYIVPLSGNPE